MFSCVFTSKKWGALGKKLLGLGWGQQWDLQGKGFVVLSGGGG